MNQTIHDLTTRRSVRAYTNQMPSDEDIETICKAGSYAPSGHGTQCPIVLAVTNKAMRDRMSRLNAQVMGTDSDPFYGAPVVLVVLVDMDTGLTPIEDGCLAMGNMLNAAHALGLASCWINYRGIGNCIVGYPAQQLPNPKPRKEGFIHWVK